MYPLTALHFLLKASKTLAALTDLLSHHEAYTPIKENVHMGLPLANVKSIQYANQAT